MTRKEANMEIIRLMVNEINQHPDQRFGQILRNMDVIKEEFVETGDDCFKMWKNTFNEESTETHERVLKSLRQR